MEQPICGARLRSYGVAAAAADSALPGLRDCHGRQQVARKPSAFRRVFVPHLRSSREFCSASAAQAGRVTRRSFFSIRHARLDPRIHRRKCRQRSRFSCSTLWSERLKQLSTSQVPCPIRPMTIFPYRCNRTFPHMLRTSIGRHSITRLRLMKAIRDRKKRPIALRGPRSSVAT
jgi:hypothetical protein